MEKNSKEAEWREVYDSDAGHFRALRTGIVSSFIVLLISFAISFCFSKSILDFILDNGRQIGYEFIYLSPIEIVAQQIKISFIIAFAVTLPLFITQVLIFIKPAIDGPMIELVKVFIFALILFLIGAAFSYLILMPFSFNMFYQIGLETNITAQISVQKYTDLYVALVVALGIVFEIPLVAAFLSTLGLIKSQTMCKGRMVALIIIMALSNIITPTTDIFTALLVDVPMYGLYEVSILICKHIERKKVKLSSCPEE